MTLEQRLIQQLGGHALAVLRLMTELEEARKRIAELEKLVQAKEPEAGL